eukprot:gene3226-3533_t
MIPINSPAFKEASASETTQLLAEAERNLQTISTRIQELNQKATVLSSWNDNKKKEDWTSIYDKCSTWQELDDLQAKRMAEEERIHSLQSKQETLSGHYHDHHEERAFFDLPEDVKAAKCFAERDVANYLVSEGNFSKALDRYQTAISYAEYCFPTEDKDEEALDACRRRCWSNLALCQIQLGLHRNAIESASRLLAELPPLPPSAPTTTTTTSTTSLPIDSSVITIAAEAFYRRAVAHRYLDEYDEAMNDLTKAMELTPSDPDIIEEISILKELQEGYRQMQQNFATKILHSSSSTTSSSSAPAAHKEKHVDEHENKNTGALDDFYFTLFDPNMPVEPIIPLELQRFYLQLTEAPKSTKWLSSPFSLLMLSESNSFYLLLLLGLNHLRGSNENNGI